MKQIAIKVEQRWENCIDFIVSADEQNLYRFENGKMRKLFGFGKDNFGKAIRGNIRKQIEELARTAFENNLPFAVAIV